MTITSATARNDYTGSGSSGPYAFTFKVFAYSHLVAYVTDLSGNTTTLAWGAGFSATGVNNAVGGTITFTTAITAGYAISIQRSVPLTQLFDYRNQSEFFPANYENGLDYEMMALQELAAAQARMFQLPAASTITPIVGALTAGDYLRVNLAGTGIEAVATVVAAQNFLQSGTGAVTRSANSKMGEVYSVTDFGAKGDGTTNNATAFAAATAAALAAGRPLFFPNGVYLTSSNLTFTTAITLIGESGTRIKLASGSFASVISIDGSAGANIYGARVENLILDGNGNATDGLLLKNVVSSDFPNVRVTNVTGAGFHLAWAQLCTFWNPTVSHNVELFTTTPVNGILADGAESTANTFINATLEGVSGSGVKGPSLTGATFLNGTSEGNNIGIEFGATSGATASLNLVLFMDIEANTTNSVWLLATANNCTFIGLAAVEPTLAASIKIVGGGYHSFFGGGVGAISLDSTTLKNRFDDVKIYGTGNTITDGGVSVTYNSWRGLSNVTDGTLITEKPVRRETDNVPAGGGTVPIDCSLTAWVNVNVVASTLTIGAPTNMLPATEIDITIRNLSGAGITTTWNAAFRITGWVDPATGNYRSARFRYDGVNATGWQLMSMTTADQAN